MKLPQVSTAFMLASSMVQRAMAEGPQATPATADDPEVIDGYAILYSLIGFFALTSCCCLCCEIINDRNDGNYLTAQVLGGPSTNQVQDPVPIEPPSLTGVPVSPNFCLATQPSAQSVTSVPVSPAVGLAGQPSAPPATDVTVSPAVGLAGQPSAPPATGIPVSADLGLAPEGSPSFAGIGQLSPSPEALALSASPSLATIPNSSDPV